MTRKALKNRAKTALKNGSFWTGYSINLVDNFIFKTIKRLVSTFFMALVFGTSFSFLLEIVNDPTVFDYMSETEIFVLARYITSQFSSIFAMRFLIYGLMFFLSILLFNVLTVGKQFWFSRNREQTEKPPFSYMFDHFRKRKYKGTIKGMAWHDIWLYIWRAPSLITSVILAVFSFAILDQIFIILQDNYSSYGLEKIIMNKLGATLFGFLIVMILSIIISAIFSVVTTIKSYSYRAAGWLLADNPHLDFKKALTLSKSMTKGFKWQWFVLDLSFIAWYLLLMLTLPLIFFTAPLLETYTKACEAEFYAKLRDDAVTKGLVNMQELGFVQINPMENQGNNFAKSISSNQAIN